MGFITNSTQGSSTPSSVFYSHEKDWQGTLEKKSVVVPASKIPREISVWTDKPCNIYYGSQSIEFWAVDNNIFIDSSVGSSLTLEPTEGKTNVKLLVRAVKPVTYAIGVDNLMIPIEIKLAVGTGDNFFDINESSYDNDEYQYLINLQKLKNSDSGITGYKLFDIVSFYPGKVVDFNVNIDSDISSNYEPNTIAVQLFNPLDVGEVLFAIANDVINLEVNNLGERFVGNLTRNAYYKAVENNKLGIKPNFSSHVGRFIAKNLSTQMYDTVIIKEYQANDNPLLGGTFILTGDF